MNKKVLFIILLLLFVILLTSCSPSEYTYIDVYGRVINNNSSAIKEAKITINNNSILTDSKGNFKFKNISGNRFITITVQKEGYWTKEYDTYIGEKDENIGIIRLDRLNENTASVSGKVTIGPSTSNQNNIQSLSTNDFKYIPVPEYNDNLDYVEGEILVKFKDTVNAQNIIQNSDTVGKITALSTTDKVHKVRVRSNDNYTTEELLKHYQNMDSIEFVSYNYIGHLMNYKVPNDPYYEADLQWNLNYTNMPYAWYHNTGSSAVTVAVIDTGYLPHEDLLANIDRSLEYDFTDRDHSAYDEDTYYNNENDYRASHGTHVSGIIGAIGDNNKGITGVNWDINIMPLRIFEVNQYGEQYFTSENLIDAIYYAVNNGAAVINLSIAYGGRDSYSSSPQQFPLEEIALEYAYKSNVTVVAAAGNSGKNHVYYPASSDYTIAVGATNINNELAPYSNYGSELDILAPGGDFNNTIESGQDRYYAGILSTHMYPNEEQDYLFMEGTSMAAPHVSGVAALLVAQGIREPYVIKDILTATADKNAISGNYNADLLNAEDALLEISETPEHHYLKAKVFAAYEEGNTYYLLSNITGAEYDGYYELNYVKANSNLKIIAWIDENNDNKINSGDYLGKSESLFLGKDEKRRDINVNMEYLNSTSSSISNTEKNIVFGPPAGLSEKGEFNND